MTAAVAGPDGRRDGVRVDQQRVRQHVDEPGRAPTAHTASAVATKVLVGTITSSPGPIPRPARISSSASVPFATPTHAVVSQ